MMRLLSLTRFRFSVFRLQFKENIPIVMRGLVLVALLLCASIQDSVAAKNDSKKPQMVDEGEDGEIPSSAEIDNEVAKNGTGYEGGTKAEYAYMMDFDTGAVLLDKRSRERMHPASMTKLMTAYLVFEKLKNGSLKLDDKFHVSVQAWKMGGSKMFVKEGDDVAISDLIRGVIVQSGNDACVVIAEGIAGSEEAFAEEMNRKAKELGMTETHFLNATGMPEEEHLMSVRDLSILARHLIEDFPEFYPIYSTKEFTYANIRQSNRNPLLYRSIGADGLKTGYTEQSGYGLVASAVQDDRRVILVVNGLKSSRERAAETERLIRIGFREFKNVNLFKKGEIVEEAEVWMGKEKSVPLIIDEDIKYTVPRNNNAGNQNISVTYEGPITAPVKKGDHIANLIIKDSRGGEKTVPLYAGKNISELSAVGRFFVKLKHYFSD